MPYVYGGPSHDFYLEEGGKAYHPGDSVPIAKARAEHMAKFGHIFEGIDAPESFSVFPAGASGATVQETPKAQP